jgi:CHRD domain
MEIKVFLAHRIFLRIYLNTPLKNRILMYAKTTLVLIITIALALASVNAAGVITLRAPLAFAAQGQKFTAKLTGQNEVPPTATRATGSLEMELSPDGMISHYVLNVTNIGNVISTQIHEGANGTNGPVIVTLSKSIINGTMINGTLSQGTVYSKLFEGPFAGKHISDLIILINNGKAYVNINTKQNALGEIRGQLSSVTSGTVPEFGTTATAIFAIALIGIMVASTKYIGNKSFIKKL